ncbi:MAG: hypothetical protein EHM61_16280 [Acidobacteria bacterium]|nr:MAG: hypothetical protein EHM61_16280 [Acidobacteriota bacterium]
MKFRSGLLCLVIVFTLALHLSFIPAYAGDRPGPVEFRILATKKTSTMQKEMSEAAAAGFKFAAVMGGETAFGGSEAVVVMSRQAGSEAAGNLEYRLLATSKTSTMQKEMQEAADAGFEYRGQTVFSSAFGGDEVCVIMERPAGQTTGTNEYKLLGTSKTSTLQKELAGVGEQGFTLVGLTVGQTAFGGNELIAILKRPR